MSNDIYFRNNEWVQTKTKIDICGDRLSELENMMRESSGEQAYVIMRNIKSTRLTLQNLNIKLARIEVDMDCEYNMQAFGYSALDVMDDLYYERIIKAQGYLNAYKF